MAGELGVEHHVGIAQQGAKVARSSTELERRLQSERELALERRDRDGSPEQLPELEREVGLVTGALAGVEQRAAELIVALDQVVHHDTLLVLEKVRAERQERLRRQEEGGEAAGRLPGALTPTGQRLRELYDRLGELEDTIGAVRSRLGC